MNLSIVDFPPRKAGYIGGPPPLSFIARLALSEGILYSAPPFLFRLCLLRTNRGNDTQSPR